MRHHYINGIGSVGIQEPTFDLFRDVPKTLQSLNKAQHPSYRELIAPAMIRRMGSGVKMGIYAADMALKEANVASPDAIITGSGLGCVQDSEKFLENIIANDEEFLTPTSFIQSTHNTVGAQIALHLGCKSYNLTYVNGGNSFESALLDSRMQLRFSETEHVLVGGVDEVAPYTYNMYTMAGKAKAETDSIDFKKPTSSGIPLSEGASFFVLSNTRTEKSYAVLRDVVIFNKFASNAQSSIDDFLEKNALSKDDIDVVILGANADQNQQEVFDRFTEFFKNTSQAYYQHISGGFDTASAYGFKTAAEVLRRQELPRVLLYNDITPRQLRNILLLNQAYGTDYSFVLLSAC